MNLIDARRLFWSEAATSMALYTDSAIFRYLTAQIEELQKRGENIAEYELIFVRNDPYTVSEDGTTYKITNTVRLHKIGTDL